MPSSPREAPESALETNETAESPSDIRPIVVITALAAVLLGAGLGGWLLWTSSIGIAKTTSTPDPVWPVILLAAVSVFDGALCITPAPFIARCLTDVGWPRRFWWTLAPVKFAAGLGLIAGIWLPGLGLLTCGCLVLYFIVAIVMHIRARDLGRNLFVNAAGMLAISLAVLIVCFLV